MPIVLGWAARKRWLMVVTVLSTRFSSAPSTVSTSSPAPVATSSTAPTDPMPPPRSVPSVGNPTPKPTPPITPAITPTSTTSKSQRAASKVPSPATSTEQRTQLPETSLSVSSTATMMKAPDHASPSVPLAKKPRRDLIDLLPDSMM